MGGTLPVPRGPTLESLSLWTQAKQNTLSLSPRLWALGTAAPSPLPGAPNAARRGARPPLSGAAPNERLHSGPRRWGGLRAAHRARCWGCWPAGPSGHGLQRFARGAARVTWIYLQWGYRGALKLEGPGPREHPATWVPEAASSGVTESVLVRQEVPGRFPRTGSPGPRAGATSSSFPLGQLHSSPAMSSPHSSARERPASWGRDRTPLGALASPKLPGSCPMTAPAPTVGLITHSVTPVPF